MTQVMMILKLALCGLAVGAAATNAHGDLITIHVQEIGNDIVIDLSGSVNYGAVAHLATVTDSTDKWALFSNSATDVHIAGFIRAAPADIWALGAIEISPLSVTPLDFSRVSFTGLSSSTGDFFAFDERPGSTAFGDRVWLPSGYVSQDPLQGSGTIAGMGFDDLGITAGANATYSANFGPNTNTISVITTGAAVPEPAAILLSMISLVPVVLTRRRGKWK